MKFIKALAVKKFREQESLFIAEGEKTVNELLHSSIRIHSLYFIREWRMNLNPSMDNISFEVSEAALSRISLLESPNKVLAVAHIPEVKFEPSVLKNSFTLALDSIQDPGNFGTILRTADWFGIKNIICSEETTDAFSPKVVQSSMGSVFRLNIYYVSLKNVLQQANKEYGTEIYAGVLDGESIFEQQLSAASILLLGNESKGISSELLQIAGKKISIPKAKGSKAESLNVSAAAAIFCNEFLKVRNVFSG